MGIEEKMKIANQKTVSKVNFRTNKAKRMDIFVRSVFV